MDLFFLQSVHIAGGDKSFEQHCIVLVLLTYYSKISSFSPYFDVVVSDGFSHGKIGIYLRIIS